MEGKYGKYYLLDVSKQYFCVDLQRTIKFDGTLAVKCDCCFGEHSHFGKLINTNFVCGPDYETNNEIEFSDCDIISEYQLRQQKIMYFNLLDKK